MLINSPGLREARPKHTALSAPSKSERYLHDLLSDVAGMELHRAGLALKVKVEPGTRPFQLEDQTLSVDPSLFSVLTKKEELAFLVAQQAALAITDADVSGLQFGADQMALDMMVEAGLNPAGGYSALEKLYQAYPTEAPGDGLEKAAKTMASGQEHEGIRLAVAQLELEQLRRIGEPTTKIPLSPAPQFQTESLAVQGEGPDLRPESNLEHTLERAFARLQGKPHEARLEGVLETLVAATEKGLLGDKPLTEETGVQLNQTFSKPTGVAPELHQRFLKTLLNSDSLRRTLHPLGKPWQDFLSNLVSKRGRLGLPEGLLVLNQLAKSENEVEFPPELAKVREEVAVERLSPPFRRSSELSGFLNELYNSQSWAPFSEEFKEGLPSRLLDLARTAKLDPDFQHTLGEPKALHSEVELEYLKMLESGKLNSQDTQAVSEFLALHHNTDHSWPEDPLSQKKLRALLPQAKAALADGFAAPQAFDLTSTISDIYSLDPKQFGKQNSESLSHLLSRVRDGEFEVKEENFASRSDFRKAKRQFKKARAEGGRKLELLAAKHTQSVLIPLTAVGSDPEALAEFSSSLDATDYSALLADAEEALEQARVLKGLAGSKSDREHVNVTAGLTLMRGWLAVQDEVKDLEQWHDLTRRTVEFCSPVVEMEGNREVLGEALWNRLESLEPQQQQAWLRRPYVSHLLNNDRLLTVLTQEVDAANVIRPELAKKIDSLEQEFRLSTHRPVLYTKLRNQISKEARLQPQEIDSIFPPDERNQVEKAQGLAAPLAGLSGLLTLTREQPPEVQLKTIEYLMGQSKEAPAFLDSLDQNQGYLPMHALLRQAREELGQADSGLRIMVANAFLAGPSGLLRKEGGTDILLEHFLSGIREQERRLVERLAQGVLQAQGEADSLAVAALLAQKPGDGKQLTEAEMLSSFFDAYGVPGIKMKQYFAFTTKAQAHSEAFAGAQDNARPVSHYQALRLLRDRFGGQWPEHLKVQGVLGNGSVNVAVKLLNEKTGQVEIASVNRRDIQQATEYDFQHFQTLFETLTQNPEDKEEFGFVLGLMKIVKDSVDLEFDREAALKIQQTAFKTYDHHYDGWHVKSIDAFRNENQSLFMEEAKGVTARKLKASNPELYKKAMTAMHKAEMAVLRGQPEQGDVLPRALFANPDFHDGQVLVDPETKEVTILDFGQAVPISVEERKAALDLLTVFGKGDGAARATKRLNERFFDGDKVLTREQLEPILEKKEMMGRFIHLLSLISREGGEVPLSSVNWILGLNRQITLGKKLDLPVERQVKTMVASHKLGLGLGMANTLHAVGRNLTRFGAALTGWCCAGSVDA